MPPSTTKGSKLAVVNSMEQVANDCPTGRNGALNKQHLKVLSNQRTSQLPGGWGKAVNLV